MTLTESIVQAWLLWTATGTYCGLAVLIIDRDMRRLPPERRARAWSTVSFAAAVFTGLMLGLPQIAIVVHFVRTRGFWLGVPLGVGWAALTFVPVFALAGIVGWFFPE